MPRSSAVSSRCSSISRASKIRSRSLRGLQRTLRSAPRYPHQGFRARGRGRTFESLHRRSFSCPIKRSISSTKRAAKLRTEIDSMPQELDEASRPHHATRDRTSKRSTKNRRRRIEAPVSKTASKKRLAELRSGTDVHQSALAGRERFGSPNVCARLRRADRTARKIEIDQAERPIRSQSGRAELALRQAHGFGTRQLQAKPKLTSAATAARSSAQRRSRTKSDVSPMW